jgi:hypothetical protein
VTNQEWRRCKDPAKMIEALKDIASDRKSILYMCAGCRFTWKLLYDDRSKVAVDVAERFVEGLATLEELKRANWEAECPTFQFDFELGVWRTWECCKDSVPQSVQYLVRMGVLSEEQLLEDEPAVDPVVKRRLLAAASLAEAACSSSPFRFFSGGLGEYISLVDWPGDWLLRCVFGKPFLPPVVLDPDWLTSNVVGLAGMIYEERAFTRMPSLGDALEEAGCGNEDILKHCRSDKPHVRGCWVVDMVLGKL